MRTRYFVTITLAIVAVLAGNPMAQKGGGGGGNTLFPVTAEFRCPLTATCIAQDGLEGDMLGLYRGTTQGGSPTTREGTSSNNGSYLTEGNLFLFVLKPGLGRFVSFDFSRQLGTAPCAGSGACRRNFTAIMTDESPHGSRTYPVDTAGRDLSNGFMSVPVGGSARARFFMNFADQSGRDLLWTVRFDPALHPGSTLLTVTRPAQNTWTIESMESDVAGLLSATTSGRSVKVNEGFYTLPFRITIAR